MNSKLNYEYDYDSRGKFVQMKFSSFSVECERDCVAGAVLEIRKLHKYSIHTNRQSNKIGKIQQIADKPRKLNYKINERYSISWLIQFPL